MLVVSCLSSVRNHTAILASPTLTVASESGLTDFGSSDLSILLELQGTRYKVQGTSYRVQGTRYKLQGTSYKVQTTRYKLQGTSYKVQGTRYKVQNTRYKVQGTRYKT